MIKIVLLPVQIIIKFTSYLIFKVIIDMAKINEITKEEDKFEYVKTGTKKVTYHVCSDGKQYLYKADAVQHEEKLEQEQMKKNIKDKVELIEHKDIEHSLYELILPTDNNCGFATWFKFKSVEEVKTFLEYIKISSPAFFRNNYDIKYVDRYPLNEWILIIGTEDTSGDFYDTEFYIYKTKQIKDIIEKTKDNIEKITNDIPQ